MKFETVYEVVSIKQVVREVEFGITQVRSQYDAVLPIQNEIGDEDREVFFVLCLNMKMEVVAFHKASVGALNMAIVIPREVFKSAILNNSAAIIVAHNHPSGNTMPSEADIQITKRVVEAGEILGIEVLDHLIVSPNKFTSLKEKGYM